jgi:SprB repeat/Chlamydia polymorphic membrane protein (Chlamydia_PMP) repeat
MQNLLPMRTALYTFLVFLFISNPSYGKIIYVNHLAVGANDGTDWQDAHPDLHDALSEALPGDTIWVAEGTYYPSQAGDRAAYFELKNGVKLMGGFAGTETELSERDWLAHPTTLSGDLGVPNDSTDNSYTILYIGTSDTTTLVDGLTFVRGNADGPAVFDRNLVRAGGALYIMGENSYAYPRIWNCRFEHNYALKFGGAAYVNGVNGSVAPQFYNCVFESNHAGADGGAIRRDGGSWVEVKNDFWDCTFLQNSAGQNGGAILYRETERTDTLEFVGCTFQQNHAVKFGGGISHFGGRDSGTKVLVIDCVFEENIAAQGGGYHSFANNFLYSDFFRFQGCSFIANQVSTSGSGCYFDAFFLDDSYTNLLFDHCLFEQNIGGDAFGGVLDPSTDLGRYKIQNCDFIKNVAIQPIYLNSNSAQPSIIDKCNFIGNSAITNFDNEYLVALRHFAPLIFTNNTCIENGGIFKSISSLFADTVTHEISNSTFYNNITNEQTTMDVPGNYHISNSIIVADSLTPANFPFNGASIQIDNAILSATDCSSLPSNVTCGTNMLFNLDPLFADTAAHDFRLHPCSPAINAGDNAIVDSLGILTDIAGNPRIQGGTVDMGAYESPPFAATATAVLPALCHDGEGSVSLGLGTGCPPFFLEWNGGSTITDTAVFGLPLPAGSYTITVTDGRMDSDTIFVILEGPPPLLTATTATDIACPGGPGGMVTTSVTGGTAPYTYLWSTADTSFVILEGPAGTYAVTVTDANGCSLADSVTVETTGNLTLSINVTPTNCHDSNDGTAAITPLGGTAPFAWLWQDDQTDSLLTGLGGGSWSVTVTDALGCTGDVQFSMTAPDTLVAEVTGTGASCFGEATGEAAATATGGTEPYSYQWSNAMTTPVIGQLPPGWYSVTVTGLNQCNDTASVFIASPPALDVAVEATQRLCFGENDGTAAALASGGTPPYSFEWETGQTDSLLTGLPPGSYAVTVTDGNGCTGEATAVIDSSAQIQALFEITHATGAANADGGVEVSLVFGGTPGYEFLWSNGAVTQSLENVLPGPYSLTVTDADSCQNVFYFTVDVENAAGEEQAVPFRTVIVPNPSGTGGAELWLEATQPQMLAVQVLDGLGRVLFSKEAFITAGETRWNLPQGLPPGVYWVVVKNGDGAVRVLKWVVM